MRNGHGGARRGAGTSDGTAEFATDWGAPIDPDGGRKAFRSYSGGI